MSSPGGFDAEWPEVVGSPAKEAARRFLDDTEVSPHGMGVHARHEHTFGTSGSTLSEYQFKTIFVGSSGVGKTQLANIIVHERSDFSLPRTQDYDRYRTLVEAREGFCVQLDIWDTAGQDLYNAIVPMFFRNAVMAIVVYSVNSRSSFESAKKWLKQLADPRNAASYPCAAMPPPSGRPSVALFASKADLANHLRSVAFEEGAELAKQFDISFAEVSCIRSQNRGEIQHILSDLVRQVLSATTGRSDTHRPGTRRRAASSGNLAAHKERRADRPHRTRRAPLKREDPDVPRVNIDDMVRVVKENRVRIKADTDRDRSDIENHNPATSTCC